MNKLLYIGIALLLLVMPLSLAAGRAPTNTDTVAYWALEDLTDETGSFALTAFNSPTNAVGGIIDNRYEFTGNIGREYLRTGDPMVGYTEYSMSVWFKADDTSTDQWILKSMGDELVAGINIKDNDLNFRHSPLGAGFDEIAESFTDTSSWHHAVMTWDGSDLKAYLDNVYLGSTPSTTAFQEEGTNFYICSSAGTTRWFDGQIDEVILFDVAIIDDNVEFLYNGGSPTSNQQYPFVNNFTNFTVSVVDEWTGNSVNNISVSVDGTIYTNTTGNEITTTLYQNDTSLYDVILTANNYFNKTYSNVNVTTNLAGTIYQSSINFTAKELFTNNTLSNVTFYVNSSENTTFHLSEGWYNVTAVKSDYYNLTYEFFVVALDNLTVDVPGLYNSVVSVNLTDAVTASLISSSSYVTVDNGAGFVQTFNEVNGSLSMNLLQDNYSLTLWVSGYVYRYETVIVNNITEFFNFSLYANNSVWVTAKNLSSDASLVNFSVSISGADFSSSVNDSGSGRVVFDNVSSGVYSVVVSKDGFSSSSYVLSMAGGSHQNIVAYLFTGDDTVLFTTVDSFSNAIMEGASGGLYSLLNNTWVLVSSQLSDITGRIQFDILSDVSYKFIFDAVGYDQKVVLLKPLFASYTARLDPSVSVTPDVNVGDWIFSMNNSGEFFNGVNNSFLVSVLSTMGTLEYYYVNITDESGLVTELFCGVAGGCDNSTWLDISGASYDDVIGIELWVKESGVVLKYFKTLYLVQDVYNDFTARAWRDADFGDLEKALAASLVLLILVGFVSVGASFLGVPVVTVSAVVLGVGAEFFGAGIGFFPASIGHLIALGCLLIVLFGRGGI